MSRLKKIIVVVLVAVVCAIGAVLYGISRVVSQIPDAYAAWDTGTLLIAFMEANHDEWPSSWDDLAELVKTETDNPIPLRGLGGNAVEYVRSLRDRVSVDWSFDPERNHPAFPVTRPDGGKLPTYWEDPNRMIREYLDGRSE